MPNNNSQPRKRKQPSSPSPNNSRQSPYNPNNDPSRNNSNRGRGGRRQSGNSQHFHHQQQTQQQTQHQQINRTPSRLSVGSTPTDNSPTNASFAPAPVTSAPMVSPATEPEQIIVDSPPSAPKEFYYWEYVTDDAVQNWSSTGAAGVKAKFAELATKGQDSELELSIVFQEIIKAAIDARLSITDCAKLVTDIVEAPESAVEGLDLTRMFLQAVAVFDPTEMNSFPMPNLAKLLNELHPKPFPTKTIQLSVEAGTLQLMGFVNNAFPKKVVRVTTGMVYKQRKHNLLREETEGFAKLITEFFTSSYAQLPLEVVDQTGERVKGLIGAFELDPGRVLDILLDTAACTVVSNARFFVRLLETSSWWPQGVPETGPSKRLDEKTRIEKEKEKERTDNEFFAKLEKEGIAGFFEKLETSKGNKVAAQLLGFKFRYYQQDDVSEQTPENLLVLSALLIKIGFIDLVDLYPHLSPAGDDEMNEIKTAWLAKMEDKTKTGRRNALMMAGALGDDGPSSSRTRNTPNDEKKPVEEAKKEEAPKPKKDDNQKLVLLKYLLAVAALPEALFILAKYPWLPGPSDDIAEHIGRVIIQSLENISAPMRPKTAPMGSKSIAVALTGKNGGVELYDQPRKKPMVTFTVSNLNTRSGDIEYRFFWEDWKDGVPICRNAAHVVILMKTLGRMLGVRMGREPGVMTRVCRIGRSAINQEDCTDATRDSWIEIARTLIVPAVSLTDGNQGVVSEVWRLLELFPMEVRYSLYGEWVSFTNKRLPELKTKVLAVEKETKDLLKRISKQNVGRMARQLAKVATSNPITVMQVVLSQVEGYDNLIECVVDAAADFTPLGFDAIGYCVLNSMSNEKKNRVQSDGMLTSKWLQSLAVFCGKIYTRYYRVMDPAPILEYVARQLKRQNSVELVVLQELIQSMGGINQESNLNDAQLQGLAGGECLRSHVLQAFRDRKAEDSPKTMKTLTDTLFNKGLADQLLILIAQERQTCIHRVSEDEAPLKVLGNLFDEIHLVLSQYLDVMKQGLTPEKFEQAVPSVADLCLKYGIDHSIAWWISRVAIRSKMKKLEAPDAEDVEMKEASETSGEVAPPGEKTPWNPVLKGIMDEIMPVLPEQVWTKISPAFYVTFWQLEIYDIFVPMDAYQAETNRINVTIRTLDQDRSDVSTVGQQRKRERRDELMAMTGRLSAELKLHIRENSMVRKRLNAEKDYWFNDDRFTQREITENFIQYCIFPRIMISPNDASFCSRFIREVHKLNAPKFHTIGIYDSLFGKGLGTVMHICTQREAENYGRFLREVLSDLHAWHGDRALYEREAHGSSKTSGNSKTLVGFFVKNTLFDWEDFRKILYKWHKTLHIAVKNCLSSGEYMHIRNAIVVLKHVGEFFPSIDWIGRTVLEKIEFLVKVEKREDLKIAASTLQGMLKRRSGDWVVVQVFQKSDSATPAGMSRPSPAPGSQEKADSPAPSQQTSQPGSRPLSAVAKEYKPNAPTSDASNGSQTAKFTPPSLPSKPDAGDKEDGEIDDARNRRGQQPVNLPQRPVQSLSEPRRLPTQGRDIIQQQQSPHDIDRALNRTPTPRRDVMNDNRRPNERTEINRPPMRNTVQPSHQLPDRPEIPRQANLERREPMRESRESPRIDNRGRPDGRLPEKPMERRHSPRGDMRDMRGDRRDQDQRGNMGRDRDFSRQSGMQHRDDRNQWKDERIMTEPPKIPGSGARSLQQIIQDDDRRLDRRRSDRGQDIMGQQSGRLNDYPERLEHPEHRMLDRKQDQIPQRQLPEPTHQLRHSQSHDDLSQRPPPVGPRANFDTRDNRRNQPQDRELFNGPQGNNQMRVPASGPNHLEQFRDNRHPAPGSFHHQDPNHGRLNPPDTMIPKGPRDRNVPPFGPRGGALNIRGAAGANVPNTTQSPSGSQQTSPSQSQAPPSRPPLPSPALDIPNRKIDMPPPVSERQSHNSAPSTPTVDAPGVHPDRLRAMGLTVPPPPPPQPPIQILKRENYNTPSISSTVNANPPPLGPRVGSNPRADLIPNSMQHSNVPGGGQGQKQDNPPTGPARRDGTGVDEARNNRRRIMNVQSHLGGDQEVVREIRGRGRRNGTGIGPLPGVEAIGRGGSNSGPPTPTGNPETGRRQSASGIHDLPSPPRRHHRDRGDRSDRGDRDRRALEAEREREREREFIPHAHASTSSSRKGSDREREHRSERDRDHRSRVERTETERERERDGRRTRGEKHPRGESGSDKVGRDETKRRRRGGDWGGQ
ncbi:transcription factor/nuclear export subunit protein 2-domain-containing protein [Geopyxis carbonaria]|nr:transcription factor/nuclear export subunit protein 2-domain-containing protein [Geopyxis carbonaria]